MGTSFRSTLTTCTSLGRGAASAGLFERLTKIRKARTKAAARATVGIRTLRLARIVFSWARMIVSVLACYHSFQFTAANRRVELPRPPSSDRISLKSGCSQETLSLFHVSDPALDCVAESPLMLSLRLLKLSKFD